VSDASLPYNGTEGYAGSETSADRAFREAIDGTASTRQRFILIMADRAKERGITVAEVRDQALHHGRVSGALSVLHKAGKLARLHETRNRCKVYVLPEYVNGRPTEAHGVVHKADQETLKSAEFLDGWLNRWYSEDTLFDPPLSEEDNPVAQAVRRLVDYAQGRT
jgi:hypothetical protein